jgi:hypothetical protein
MERAVNVCGRNGGREVGKELAIEEGELCSCAGCWQASARGGGEMEGGEEGRSGEREEGRKGGRGGREGAGERGGERHSCPCGCVSLCMCVTHTFVFTADVERHLKKELSSFSTKKKTGDVRSDVEQGRD